MVTTEDVCTDLVGKENGFCLCLETLVLLEGQSGDSYQREEEVKGREKKAGGRENIVMQFDPVIVLQW